MTVRLRDYRQSDAISVDTIALAAFEQFRDRFSDWPAFANGIGKMSALSQSGEMIVAEVGNEVVGAVVYVGPDKDKAPFFDRHWPIMRMLVVSPRARGIGAGRALAEACIARAYRDKAAVFALHTSRIMTVALPMYERMGFRFVRDAPAILGVPYGVYIKELS